MRPLTHAEAIVIRSMLAGEPMGYWDRIGRTGLPRSTYQAAIRRVTEAGWVSRRYVPDPVQVGRPLARVALALGPGAAVDRAAPIWAGRDGAATVWRGSTMLLGVFFDPAPAARAPGGRPDPSHAPDLAETRVSIDLRTAAIPVYFDFEAAWSRIVGSAGTSQYPRSLPAGGVRETDRLRVLTPRWTEVVREIVQPETAAEGAEAAGGFRGLGHRARVRRAVEEGWVDPRAFLDLSRLPGYQDWQLSQVVFVSGRLRPGRAAEILLRSLIVRCGVSPFLFAADATTVLYASLSPPPPGAVPAGRASVTRILEIFLTEIAVHRQPAADMVPLVDHRYERLFASSPRSGQPR